MSYSKIETESDRHKKQEVHSLAQLRFAKLADRIIVFSVLGVLLPAIMSQFVHESAAMWLLAYGVAGYLLGFTHCKALWAKEKDNIEWFVAIEEYETIDEKCIDYRGI